MAQNYVLLERIELNASAASVTFANIPQSGYTDLKVVGSARTDRTGSYEDAVRIQLNASGGTAYSTRRLYGNGSTASSNSDSSAAYSTFYSISDAANTANTFGNFEIYVPNYSSTTTNKSISVDMVSENNATDAIAGLGAGLWASTAAINQVTLTPNGGTVFLQYSTFSLYALAAVGTTPAIAPKASGGNITTDGTYWYHTFLATSTFTPATSLSADVLVIAGGGAGSSSYGGGGGAGGLAAFTSQLLVSGTGYTCTIGAGGTRGTANTHTTGVNSQFGSLTAAVGGGKGGFEDTNGAAGGSGGGGGGSGGTSTTGGSATSGQGFAGGSNFPQGGVGPSGGGGGAAAVGGNASSNNGGLGGAGSSAYSSWGLATTTGQNVSGTYYFAGGGGGGLIGSGTWAGGNGGGGTGAGGGSTSTVGTINTGGGGGAYGGNNGNNGGSGIVIIRYAMA